MLFRSLFRTYIEATESGLVKDRQIAAELESCLATLTLRIRPGSEEASAAAAPDGGGIKTWFDRFKSREKDDALRMNEAAEAKSQDLETARLAIEYALGRPFGFLDEPLADEIVKRAKEKNFAITEFIHALVVSREFQTK